MDVRVQWSSDQVGIALQRYIRPRSSIVKGANKAQLHTYEYIGVGRVEEWMIYMIWYGMTWYAPHACLTRYDEP